jgi:hypothetical protein
MVGAGYGPDSPDKGRRGRLSSPHGQAPADPHLIPAVNRLNSAPLVCLEETSTQLIGGDAQANPAVDYEYRNGTINLHDVAPLKAGATSR